MSEREAFDAFTEKWKAAWPEWEIAQVFVPASQRDTALAWFALLQELAEAAWGGSDAAPGLAKLAWWQEELRGWSKGARRHPLGLVLQVQAVDWLQFAAGMKALGDREALHAPIETLLSHLHPFAVAASEIELGLFGPPAADPAALACALASPWVDTETAGPLLASWAAEPVGARPRRIHTAIARVRLEGAIRGSDVAPMSRWRTLRTAWRAARN